MENIYLVRGISRLMTLIISKVYIDYVENIHLQMEASWWGKHQTIYKLFYLRFV